jgi:hypothetical protein
MTWHPQRLMDTPEGWEDQPYIYAFDDTDFAIALSHGQEVVGLPIEMDQDADFYLCSIAFIWDGAPKWLGIRLRDGYGQYMSDDYLSIIGFGFAGSSAAAPFSSAGYTDVFEMPVYLKKGSQLLLDVKNMSDTASMTFNQPFELRGFKRYPAAEGVCVG